MNKQKKAALKYIKAAFFACREINYFHSSFSMAKFPSNSPSAS